MCFNYEKTKNLLPDIAMLSGMDAFAQGNGKAGISQIVASYFDSVTQLIYAIGTPTGLVGSVKLYNKFSNNNPHTGIGAFEWR